MSSTPALLLTCDLGDVIVLRGTLTDAAGAAVAGAVVSGSAIAPGSSTAQSLGNATDAGDGVYSLTFEPDADGPWAVRLVAAAPHTAAVEGEIHVRPTRFA